MKINGREIAQHILEALKARVITLQREQGIVPHIAVVRVGNDPAITSYVNQKEKTAEKIGIQITVYAYPEHVSEQTLLSKLQTLDTDTTIHGIILQLPIPKDLDEKKLLNTISPEKDVDGFHPKTSFAVPLASATETILHDIFIQSCFGEEKKFSDWIKEQKIVVIGKGKTGGQPIIDLLQAKYTPPIIIDSKTASAGNILKHADIIISAVGKKGILTKKMIKPGAILIGIGMGKDTDGTFYGDYQEEDIKDIAGFYTPVPGGIGPINVAQLMENIVIAAEKTLQ